MVKRDFLGLRLTVDYYEGNFGTNNGKMGTNKNG